MLLYEAFKGDKTSVESVKHGKTLELSEYKSESWLKLEIFQLMLERVEGGH